MSRRQSPCAVPGGCPDRWVTEKDRCHSSCKRFADWRAELAAEKAAKRAQQKEQTDVKISHRCKTSRQRR